MGLGICANKRTFETWLKLEIPENAKGTYQPRAGTSVVRSVVQGVKLQLKEGKAVALSWLLSVHKHLSRQTLSRHLGKEGIRSVRMYKQDAGYSASSHAQAILMVREILVQFGDFLFNVDESLADLAASLFRYILSDEGTAKSGPKVTRNAIGVLTGLGFNGTIPPMLVMGKVDAAQQRTMPDLETQVGEIHYRQGVKNLSVPLVGSGAAGGAAAGAKARGKARGKARVSAAANDDDHDEDASPEAAAAGSDAPAAAAQKKTQWVTTLVLIEYFTQLFPKWCWKEHPQREAVTVLWDGSTMHGTVVLLLYLSAAVQSNVGDILACSYEGDAWSPSAIAAARLPDISARRLITFQAKYGLDMTLPRPSADAGGVERKFLIRIRTLPPNCTALVQPADRGFIKLLKSTAVNEFTRTHEPPTMTEVPALAKKLNADFLMRSLAKTAAALEPENVQPFWYAICPELRRDRAQEKFDATKKVSEEAQKVVNAEVSRGVGQHVKTAAKETAETANKAHREATAELQRARDKLGDANKLIEDMRAEMQREDIEFRAKMANLRNPPQPKSRSRAAAKRNPPAAAAASASTAPKVTAPVVVSVPGAATVPGGPIEQADAQRAGSAEAPPRARKRPAPAGARAPVRVGAPAAKSRAFGRRN